MNTHFFRLLRIPFLTLGFFACTFHPARANMGDPARPGEPVGEPSPLLDSIHVLRELLKFDMRPLADRKPCRVEASYRLRNDGSAKTLELVFIAAGLDDSAGSFTVTLDGRPVFGRLSDSLFVPSEWAVPSFTPGLVEGDSIPYVVRVRTSATGREIRSSGKEKESLVLSASSTPTILFSIDLPGGEHTVRVSYDAHATGYPDGGPVYIWQLGYVLAPARRWAGFGGLDAQILAPKGWEIVVSPEMRRSGDTLIGSWSRLPADAIAISTRKHVSATQYWMAESVPIILVCIFALLLSFRLGWKKGVRLGLERRPLTGAIPTALLCSLLGWLLSGAAMAAVAMWNAGLVGNQGIPGYSILLFLPLVMIGAFFTPYILLLLIPAVIGIVAAAIARSRTLAVETSEPPDRILR